MGYYGIAHLATLPSRSRIRGGLIRLGLYKFAGHFDTRVTLDYQKPGKKISVLATPCTRRTGEI